MDPAVLAERRDEVQIVDVRLPNEWEAGRIEGAVHLPDDEFEDRLDELDRQRPIVTVCRSGSRSAQAAELLTEEGFEAENLDGGMLAWADAGLPYSAPDGSPGTVAEPEEPSDDHQRMAAEFMSLIFEVQDHFGDHEPSEEEIQGYLRDRLISEGHSPDEADEVMARITSKEQTAES